MQNSFLTGGMEVRMNGSCAGGTGAFIDQMATLLNVPIEELNSLAAQSEKFTPLLHDVVYLPKQIFNLCLTKVQEKVTLQKVYLMLS